MPILFRFALRGGWMACVSSSILLLAAGATAPWRSIGPYGGGAEVIVIDPTEPKRIYSLTKNSFLYKSEDEGRNWNLIPFPAQQAATAHALLIDPANPARIWIAVSSGSSSAQGIYHTSDSGVSWTHLEGLRGESVFSLALFAKDPKIMAAGARDGVYSSRDGGDTWHRISPLENRELQPVMSLAFDPRDERVLYAGTPHLPWKTGNGGESWRSIHHGMLDDSDILSLIVNPKEPTQLFIGACSGIYRSDNSADLWTKMLGITGAGYRTYAVAQDPFNPRVIFSGTRDGLWKSADGGKSWHKTAPHIVKSIAISTAEPGKMYFATQNSGVLRSSDGGETLQPALDGFADHRMSQLAAGSQSIYVTSGQESEAWRVTVDSAKGHKSWQPIALPVRGARASLISNRQKVYAVSAGGLYSSSSQGATWNRLAPLNTSVTGLAALGDRDLVAITPRSLLRSTDQGVSWKPLKPIPGAKLVRLFATPGEQGLVVETGTGFYYSADGVQDWYAAPIPVQPSEVNDIAVRGTALVAATSKGAYWSQDAGRTWQLAAQGIDPGTISALTASRSGVFAAQYGKVFQSADEGRSWKEISTSGLDGSSILRLASAPSGKLVALTPSRGVFVLEDSSQNERAGDENSLIRQYH